MQESIEIEEWNHSKEIILTKTELDFLKEQGVEWAQGYFFGKPAPIDVWHAVVSSQLHTLREKTTKTSAIRVVDIPTPLLEILSEHVAHLREQGMKKGWG